MRIWCSANRAGMVARTIVLALAIHAAGCSSGSSQQPATRQALGADAAPGVVLIDVLQGGAPEHYWQFEVQPATGAVRAVKEATFKNYTERNIPRTFQRPAGAIAACAKNPEAASSDGKYRARCASASGSDELTISDATTGAPWYVWKPKQWRGIRGFAWSSNSRFVAVLNTSSYWGKSPLELLARFSGHPVPHDTVILDVIDVRARTVSEYTVRENVVSSFSRILNWSE